MHASKAHAGRFRWLGAVIAVLLTASACVSGPVTGGAGISLSTGFDLAQVGYQRTEFFLTGVARSHTPTAPLTSNGKWQVNREPFAAAGGYKTRFVVYRPTDPSKFNGTVVVEWLNVTAGLDLANDWVMAHNELIRSGTVWVGVSAQAVGVNQLKTGASERYGSLVHPGDSYSYEMFSHAGARIRDHADSVLGGLTPQRILATGESQSASRLVTYINAIQPIDHVYDGFLVHSRGAGASSLTQAPLASVPAPSPAAIRDDLDVPVMVVQAEGDVIGSNLGARQPDTPKFRSWEMAGTSHADAYTTSVGFNDIGDGNGAISMFSLMRNPPQLGCDSPINAGPHHWILQTAFHDLDSWVRTGQAPAIAPLLQVSSTAPVVLARDAFGNALGGIRSPHVDARVATLTGLNGGPSFCRLFGSTTPLTTQQLAVLYPTHADFVSQWSQAIDAAVAAGFLLPADAPELLAAAVASQIPN